MAAERQIPGGPYVNEVATAQRQIPGWQYINETVSVTPPATLEGWGPLEAGKRNAMVIT